MGTIKDEEFKDVVERFLENVAFPRFKRYFRLCGGGDFCRSPYERCICYVVLS